MNLANGITQTIKVSEFHDCLQTLGVSSSLDALHHRTSSLSAARLSRDPGSVRAHYLIQLSLIDLLNL